MTIKVLFILYFVSDPESESIRSPESELESESEQSHHDSAPLILSDFTMGSCVILDLDIVLCCQILQILDPNFCCGTCLDLTIFARL